MMVLSDGLALPASTNWRVRVLTPAMALNCGCNNPSNSRLLRKDFPISIAVLRTIVRFLMQNSKIIGIKQQNTQYAA
jgi:hypothetical protein